MKSKLLKVFLWFLPIAIGLAISHYYYLKSIQAPDPRFRVLSNRVSILSAPNVSQASLTILTKDGRHLRSDVTAVTLDFWNDGSKEIRFEDILEPLRIKIDDELAEILDFGILQTSSDVSRVSLTKDVRSARSLSLSFRILEPRDGVRIQIIYVGDPIASISMDGSMVGARRILTSDGTSDAATWAMTILVQMIGLGVALMILFVMMWATIHWQKLPAYLRSPIETCGLILLVVIAILLIISLPLGCYESAKKSVKQRFETNVPFSSRN